MTTLPTIPDALRKLSAQEQRAEMAWILGLLEDAKERAGMPEASFRTEWNYGFTARLGDARVLNGVGVLRFSATALYLRATAKEREDLVYHEAAHALAHMKHGRRCGHGPLWKAMMRTLGREPDRCHKVNRSGLYRKNSKRWKLEQAAKAGLLRTLDVKRVELPKPAPAPVVVKVTTVPDLVGELVAWQTERGQCIGRVTRMVLGGYEVRVVGDHLQRLHGRDVTVGAAACRPY